MFERHVQRRTGEPMHGSIPRFHWQRLCGYDEQAAAAFDDHYLGTYPDQQAIAAEIQAEIGWRHLFLAEEVLGGFEASGAIELVMDVYGVHAFRRPRLPRPPPEPEDGQAALAVPGTTVVIGEPPVTPSVANRKEVIMHEKKTHGPTGEGSPARIMAGWHWRDLCGEANVDLIDEFDNNYLGWWASRAHIVQTVAADFGWLSLGEAKRQLARMEAIGELAVVDSGGGCHVFIAPGRAAQPTGGAAWDAAA